MSSNSPVSVPLSLIAPMMAPSLAGACDEAPARVRLAVEFLVCLAQKTMTRAAINSMTIEQIAGQDLSGQERAAQQAACELLGAYFAGRLTPNYWERRRTRKSTSYPNKPGMVLHCPGCMPNHNLPNCRICNGSGSILAFPCDPDDAQE